MIRTITLTLLTVAASVALAAPRIEVQTLAPAGAEAAHVATMEKVALLLSRAVSTDLVTGAVSDTLTEKAAVCADDLSYQRCLQTGGTRWDPSSLTPADGGPDAVVLYAFDRASTGDSQRGVYYIVPRTGKWVSGAFVVRRAGNRLNVRSPLAKLARQAGLEVEDRPVETVFSTSELR